MQKLSGLLSKLKLYPSTVYKRLLSVPCICPFWLFLLIIQKGAFVNVSDHMESAPVKEVKKFLFIRSPRPFLRYCVSKFRRPF
jgi:hypothetical protein